MSAQAFESVNPATGEPIDQTVVLHGDAIEQRLQAAGRCASVWRGSSMDERSALLLRLAGLLDEQQEELATLITREMGKLLRESRAEIAKCAAVCRHYAEHAPAYLADQDAPTEAWRSFVAYQPLGVVLAVMPWNFPFWQVFRFAAPAIAAGNAALLKHASNVMGCSRRIGELFRAAGAPEGLFTHLPIRSDQVAAVIADHRVRAVTLTGSDAAGRSVAALAGKALKPSVLELGGSDPFIVLPDADLERTVAKAVASRFMNAGQSCIAAKRFIVVEPVADAFTESLVAAVSGLRCGDPMEQATDLAPLARADLREELDAQVGDALQHGAVAPTGGRPVDGSGFYFEATVLTGITPAMRAYREELFGPVACVLRVADVAEAVELANASEFGLGGSVWTGDREHGIEIARQLDCGSAFVNEIVKSDPRLPFGGIKASGYGRELAALGIREFVNAKTVWVD